MAVPAGGGPTVTNARPSILRRGLATLVDDSLLAVPLAAWLVANLAVARRRRTALTAPRLLRLRIPVLITLPAALALAAAEHSGASPGKRLVGLRLGAAEPGSAADEVSWSSAIGRSLLKTAVPWEIGHQAVWLLRDERKVSGGVLAAAAYGLVVAQLIGAGRGAGRTYADRLCRTRVR